MQKVDIRAISIFNGVRRTQKTQSTTTKISSSGKSKPSKVSHPVKLRESITAGTVLIILAGKFKGKRAVFLRQLKSGLLLITGPYKYNGVPLKRINQAYVIATKTKIDISSTTVDENVDDSFFGKSKSSSTIDRKLVQKGIDSQLMPIIKKTPLLRSYLGSRFSLKKGQTLHNMKF